jgi:hypothetical protein
LQKPTIDYSNPTFRKNIDIDTSTTSRKNKYQLKAQLERQLKDERPEIKKLHGTIEELRRRQRKLSRPLARLEYVEDMQDIKMKQEEGQKQNG